MTASRAALKKLTDGMCLELLRRFLKAWRPAGSTQALEMVRTEQLARALSISFEPGAQPSAPDMARSALLVLASDPRTAAGIENLLTDDLPLAFSAASEIVDTPGLLSLIEDQVGRTNDASGEGAADPVLVRTLMEELIVYQGLAQPGSRSDAEFRVWYATSRRPVDQANTAAGFGTERDSCIHYGTCDVFVPRSHKIGSVGSPWWKRLQTMTDDRLKLISLEAMEVKSYWTSIRQQLVDSAVEDRDAVVFIHGFNVSFENAALRCAQLGFDLQVRGAMAFYSWASRGKIARYLADEAAIELEEVPITNFLRDFALYSGAHRVHVIVHSMGNRAVLRAVARIASNAEQRSGVCFGQFILAAPDVDARKFLELCPAYCTVAERTTLYVSTRDRAVGVSSWLHDFPRVGLMPPVVTADGIDTINVANADLTLLGHGYVAEARDVISDIHALIQRGTEPRHRFGLRSASTAEGKSYWLIGA